MQIYGDFVGIALKIVHCLVDNTVDGRNPKQPPGMYKTLSNPECDQCGRM